MLNLQPMPDGRWMATVEYQKAKIRIFRDTHELAEKCGRLFLPAATPVCRPDRQP